MYKANINNSDLKWLTKALASKKDIREFTHMIYINKGFAYATNGHSLYRLELNCNEQDGLYDKNGIKVETELKYPSVERVINKDRDRPVNLSIIPSNLSILKTNIEGMGVNTQYFNNAVDTNNEINLTSDDSSLAIQYNNRLAIIMFCKF